MVPAKFENEADSDYSSTSESSSMSTGSSTLSSSSSCYQDEEDISNKGGRGMQRKVKKLRSIKLARLPSLKLTTRQAKVQYDHLSVLSCDAASSQGSMTPFQMSSSSPNYMRTTTCSNAKKENLQKSARILTRRSSFKPAKSFSRLSSTKFRRPLVRKSSGGTDLKKKLKKSRSIKLANRSSIDLKATSCADAKNVHFQASSHNSETTLSRNDGNESLKIPETKLASLGSKPQLDMTRTSTLRPVRILTKTASIRAKRPSMKKGFQIADRSIDKATCSSALKDSKFPDHLELQPGGSESEGTSAMKVCPYSYCSLHGHRHSAMPPLKRFVSMRRRQLKTLRSRKAESQTSRKTKPSFNQNKGTQTSQMTAHDNSAVSSFGKMARLRADSNGEGSHGGDDKDGSSLTIVTGIRNVLADGDEGRIASSELDVHEGYSKSNSSKTNTSLSATERLSKTQGEKQKHMGLWHQIYEHMVSSVAADNEIQPPLNEETKEKQEGDDITLPGMNKTGSFQDFSGIDQKIDVEDHDEGGRKIWQYQRDAIKLVQEAFDRILSEIPDQSSDNQSITSTTTSDKELAEKDNVENRQLSISTSFASSRENTEQDQEEMVLKDVDINAFNRERAEPGVDSTSNQQTPKSWSNLKKVLIMKRFVKALEKVRKINPRKPRYLPVDADPGAERIHLRHQTMGERKNSEEWMLDCALQQVISKLAPAQKRKVALIVQAFETVSPFPEINTSPRSNTVVSSHTTPIQTWTSDCQGSREGKETRFGVILRKAASLETTFKENQDQVSGFCTAEEHIPHSCSERKETSSKNGCNPRALGASNSETIATCLNGEFSALNLNKGDSNSTLKDVQPDFVDHCLEEDKEPKLSDKTSPKPGDVLRTAHEEVLTNGVILQENPEESSISAFEVCDRDFDFDNQIKQRCEEPDEPQSQFPKDHEELVSSNIGEENELENESLQGSPPVEGPELGCITDEAREKQRHKKFWYLIYKHMVSGSATLFDEVGKEELREDGNTLMGMSTNIKDDDVRSQKIELQQSETIRLVEEAIDQIPLPEFQDDSPDDQAVASDIIPDQEQLEKKPGEKQACTEELQQGTPVDPNEPKLNSDDMSGTAQETANTVSIAGNKPKLAAQKSWSNLKKVILLKRFIKSLENVQKFNPWEPQFLPLDAGKESEQVHLRHQDTDDRKSADEWKLDYALQQVVAKLTPARKRRVSLLVEAFEAVTPLGS